MGSLKIEAIVEHESILRRPASQDIALACLATAFAVAVLVFDFGETNGDPDAVAIVGVVLAGGALLMRRRNPIAVLAIVVVTRSIVTSSTGNDVALILAAVLALFTVARTGERRSSLIIALGAAVAMMFIVAGFSSDDFLPELAGEAALMLLPIAVGDAVRSRADRVRDLIETEATARVQEERIRIARDLHDVVAHGLSTIAIQSGVAAHLLDRDPDQAKEALETINTTGKNALEELRAMVGVLRSTDSVPLRPTPSDPNDLTDVMASAANLGLRVTTDIDGQFPSGVSEACVVAVHRILSEAFTNVARHAGSVPVDLAIHHGADRVRVLVVNQAGTSAGGSVPSTGVGVIGMIERAETMGGALLAEPMPGGGFQVDATIPYQPRAAASRPR